MSDASAPASAPKPAQRLFHLGPKTGIVLLLLLLLVNVWAFASTDRDFYLPDPFRPISIGVTAAFLLTGFLRWRWLRRGLRLTLLLVVASLLVLEAHARFRDLGNHYGIERTADVLLRYRYKPGAWFSKDPHTPVKTTNAQGFHDYEHVIPKPADVYRVVVLTGSIANDDSVPFEDRFFRKLEKDLAGSAPDGKRLEVINVSCDGYNTLQQVRALEKVGLKYQPDVVVVAFMLTSASFQDGAYRRIGNSFFAFRFLPLLSVAKSGSICSLFQPFYERYTFDLIVRNSLERLDLLRRLNGFKVLVAVLPVLERFDDPICMRLYDKVAGVARSIGFETVRVVDYFQGQPFERFEKPNERWDVCHPNSKGHRIIASAIADALKKMIAKSAP